MYSVTISFNAGTFKNAADAFSFIVDYLPFPPKAIRSVRSFSEGYNDFSRDKIIECFNENNDSAFTIADDVYLYEDELNSLFYREDFNKYVQYFIFSFETLNRIWLSYLITSVHKKGFTVAYYTHKYKTQYQDQIFFDEFMKQRPASALELKMHWDPVYSEIYNEEVIDIFQNPGHQIMTYGTWLMAAPEIWFGKQAWKFFKKELVSSFTNAIEIEEPEEDLVYVKLFDAETADYETKEILNLQSGFREHIEMNRIEKELDEICRVKNEEAGADGKVFIQQVYVDGKQSESP